MLFEDFGKMDHPLPRKVGGIFNAAGVIVPVGSPDADSFDIEIISLFLHVEVEVLLQCSNKIIDRIICIRTNGILHEKCSLFISNAIFRESTSYIYSYYNFFI